MSINKIVASALLSLVVFASVAQVASAATVTVNSPDECRAIGGTPVGGNSKRCTLSNN